MQPEIQNNELTILIEKSPLELTTKEVLKEQFGDYADQVAVWKSRASGYKVTDITQKDLMSECKIARLSIKNIRVDIEKTRVRLKADSLEKGKAIDNIAKFLKAEIEPLEEYLQEQEDFEKNMIAARMVELRTSRIAILTSIEGINPLIYNIEAMSEMVFNDLCDSLRQDVRDKYVKEAQEKERIEAERKEAEKVYLQQIKDQLEREEERQKENKILRDEKDKAELETANARAEARNAIIKAETDKKRIERKLEETKVTVSTLKQTVVQQKEEIKDKKQKLKDIVKEASNVPDNSFITKSDPRRLLFMFITESALKSDVPIGSDTVQQLWNTWVKNYFIKI